MDDDFLDKLIRERNKKRYNKLSLTTDNDDFISRVIFIIITIIIISILIIW